MMTVAVVQDASPYQQMQHPPMSAAWTGLWQAATTRPATVIDGFSAEQEWQ